MTLDYGLRLKEIFTPLYGNFMYRNRTLNNKEFMENADESILKKVRRREKVTLVSSCIAIPFGMGSLIEKIVF